MRNGKIPGHVICMTAICLIGLLVMNFTQFAFAVWQEGDSKVNFDLSYSKERIELKVGNFNLEIERGIALDAKYVEIFFLSILTFTLKVVLALVILFMILITFILSAALVFPNVLLLPYVLLAHCTCESDEEFCRCMRRMGLHRVAADRERMMGKL